MNRRAFLRQCRRLRPMMGSIRLKGREIGRFFAFERDIIGSSVPKGWVRHLNKTMIQLALNPWQQPNAEQPIFVLPDGAQADEGSFVELEAGSKE
jgi:hypothetical protein